MQIPYTFLHDPGHGWLIVPRADFAAVGLTEADISPYSYCSIDYIGLEEDLDALRFFTAFARKQGLLPATVERQGSCRGWASFGTNRSDDLMEGVDRDLIARCVTLPRWMNVA